MKRQKVFGASGYGAEEVAGTWGAACVVRSLVT